MAANRSSDYEIGFARPPRHTRFKPGTSGNPRGRRKIVDVIFSLVNRATDVIEKHCVKVDVSEEFPFLVRKMSPYYDR